MTLRPPGTDVTYILAEEATINNLRIVFDSDSAVPLEDHSLRLAQRLGESVHLQVIPGGEHGTGDPRNGIPCVFLLMLFKMNLVNLQDRQTDRFLLSL